MMTSVPQFIDVEDKVAGPLTWKQIFWMIGMAAVLLVLYNLLNSFAFFVAAIPVILLFAVLAFYRPNGVSMATFLYFAVFYFFRPKLSVWERPIRTPRRAPAPKKEAPAPEAPAASRRPDEARLRELAKLLDHGRQ
jgi:hypothetical protein